ncbi:MAG: glycosyltransferase, partial [Planctomycetaceae bacterium]
MTGSAPKRMLFVIGSMGGGGAERCTVDLIARMDRARFAPELYLAYRTGELLKDVPADVPIHAHVDGAIEQSLSQKLAGKFRLLSEARMWDIHRLLGREKYDLIFAWGLRHAYETAWPAKRHGVARVSYCVQDPVEEYYVDFPHPTPWRYRVAHWSYASNDRIYANAIDLCRRTERFYHLPEKSVELFLNLRDFQRLERLAEAPAPPRTLSGHRLVCVGRFERQKGHAVMLEALADLIHRQRRDVHLVLVGQGSLEQELRAQAVRLGIADRIEWAGFQQNPVPYFKSADVFVLPSLWEGLPNVLIEALLLGIPSVATDCPTGPREVTEEGRFGTLVPPGDVGALAQAIAQALDHLPEEQARAQEASSAMRKKYDVDLGVRDLEDRFLEVIET